jgi:carbon-monoxide dehydrogenase medium subunit
VGSTIVRARKAEEVLRGKTIDEQSLKDSGEAAASECDPVDDNRGSADYKLHLVKVLVRRAVQEADQRSR